ncbi:peroxisomal sarcosine oxidase-like isoform X4 [Crassostrea angulata]|uniref:peroxisomal sarcosine oxidase-like isoform X4 n=1 Tax=Magallana angulata TaxID=2784310 RepID=UPI0022B08498|nr:peroxisomal sarcosine oxidase-like isoform X4 [Crassostrea angulata]
MYDVVVVGAGIEGSATAYNLAKNGQKTLLLEQFPLPHSRGSSHGQSRITRVEYGEDDHYAVMMKEGGKLWLSLERESGTSLLVNCGCLSVSKQGNSYMKATISSLSRNGIKYDILTPGDLRDRYPMLSLPPDYVGVFDYSGGVLRADKALRAFQTVLILVLYWKEKKDGEFSAGRFPAFRNIRENGGVYALPSLEYPGHAKVCYHDGPETDPDSRDMADTGRILSTMKSYVREHLPSLQDPPSIVEPCMYTNTPDKQFILDHHPIHRNIIIGAGFSGHGFKLAPVVGKILSELAMDKTPSYDLTPCRIDRFSSTKARM